MTTQTNTRVQLDFFELHAETQRTQTTHSLDESEGLGSTVTISFRSTVDSGFLEDLEDLFFFNPDQHRSAKRIRETVEQIGLPSIRKNGSRVWIEIMETETQCLFATNEVGQPMAVALYDRPFHDTLRVSHLAVAHIDFNANGIPLCLAECVLAECQRIARSIIGIKRIKLPYRGNAYLSVRRPK